MDESALTRAEVETVELGRRLGASLRPGAVVLLYGDLGAGKTAFVRGLAAGLGCDPDQVSSPTFVLSQQYEGRLVLHHVDLYRVEGSEIEDLGIDELIGGSAVVAIEWAERLTRPIEDAVEVTIADEGGDLRRVSIRHPSGQGGPGAGA